MESLSRNRIDLINVLLVALGGFVLGIIVGYVFFGLPSAFGLGADATYADVIKITENAANETEGISIDSYINQVKKDICTEKAGLNASEIKECMNL